MKNIRVNSGERVPICPHTEINGSWAEIITKGIKVELYCKECEDEIQILLMEQ